MAIGGQSGQLSIAKRLVVPLGKLSLLEGHIQSGGLVTAIPPFNKTLAGIQFLGCIIIPLHIEPKRHINA